MKPTRTKTKKYYKILDFVVCFVLLLFCTSAANAESNVVTEIHTSANTGSGGNSSIEVSQTTIINGERSSYHYASTTDNGSLTHDVVITYPSSTTLSIAPSSVQLTTTDEEFSKLPADNTTSTTATSIPPYIWAQLEAVFNYLYLYVEHIF